jgi:transposase-like protein
MLELHFRMALFAKCGGRSHIKSIAASGDGAVKPQEFQAFLARLDELTPEQMRALGVAMSGSRTDAIAIIEARFAEAAACPHCAARCMTKRGFDRGGLQRWHCRDCRRSFTALTGTPLAGLHKREVWLAYAKAMVEHASVRKAAKICGLDKSTSFRWRHRFLEAPREEKAARLTDIVEVDETFFLESFKGKRELPRPPRKRGGKAEKRGLSAEQIPVLVARDRRGAMADAVLPNLSDAAVEAVLGPLIGRDNVLVSDGAERYRRIADARGILHVSLNLSVGERTWGIYHIQNVNAYDSRLKGWMKPFKGVATKFLPNYLGWHRALDRESGAPAPASLLAAAIN